MTIELTSSAFNNGQAIPQKFSCDGEDISPPLEWDNLPAETSSLTLIMDDPDAPGGTWVHWVHYDISATTTELPENLALADPVSDAGKQGRNNWNKLGYGGPCPPSGSHRYFFKIYALDTHLSLDVGATKEEILREMEGHILAQGQMMGTYERS